MLNKKEIVAIIIGIFVLTFSISFLQDSATLLSLPVFLWTLLAVFLVVGINVAAKKLSGYHFDSDVDVKLWEIRRFGFRPNQHFKNPFPLGAVLPVISKLILFPLKNFIWTAALVFDVRPKIHRAVRRHGLYSFSEMTEYHLGLIAASGILANLVFAAIGYFLGFSEFARISIYYTFFNMLPLSDLDGNKIFFGNLVMWSFLASLVVIAMLFAIFIV